MKQLSKKTKVYKYTRFRFVDTLLNSVYSSKIKRIELYFKMINIDVNLSILNYFNHKSNRLLVVSFHLRNHTYVKYAKEHLAWPVLRS